MYPMEIKSKIMALIEKKGILKASEIVRETGFSRAYIARFFNELKEEGKIVGIGSGRGAYYVLAENAAELLRAREKTSIKKRFKRGTIEEDVVFKEVSGQGIFNDCSEKTLSILRYAFTEMVNNAIDHSQSEYVEVSVRKSLGNVIFEVHDRGVGIFNNIMQKKHLASELEAIQQLLKGKQTTDPAHHSGEGIFFTSKAADVMTIVSGHHKLMFHNLFEHDTAIQPIREKKGTRVVFTINKQSDRSLKKLFEEYTNEDFEFSKTVVRIRLHTLGSTSYVSRSEAKRVLSGLEKFKTIILDFKNMTTIGQSFADEIFRVWHGAHPEVIIETEHANAEINFMIQHVQQ